MKTLILIDANSIIHRCFHALPPLTNLKGEQTGALYGLSSVLLKILRERKPDYAAAFFDRPEETMRKKEYGEYKAGRPKAADELISQIIGARRVFEAFQVKTFEMPGYEADDLIGTAAERFKGKAEKIIILTGDLDATQLVDDEAGVIVETFKKGISEMTVYDERGVEEKFGVKPKQVADYKGLVGDNSDNIKGVPGVGPKTAVPLLKKYGTVEEVFKNIDEKDKNAKKLIGFEKEAIFSKKLATIDCDAPIDLGKISELEMKETDNKKLKVFFEEMGFASLVKRIGGENFKEKEKNNLNLFYKEEEIIGNIDLGEVELILNNRKDFEKNNKLKVGFNLKEKVKGGLLGPYFDLGVAFWLLDSDAGNYEPDYVFKRFLKKNWEERENNLKEAFIFTKRELEKNKLKDVFEKIEMPLVPVLAVMEVTGIKVEEKKVKKLEEEIRESVKTLEKKIYKAAAIKFNINSPKQITEVLFERLKISAEKVKKTAGGAVSTSYENLIRIKDKHEIVKLILSYREEFKMLSTYTEPILEMLKADGRLHTSYLQTGTGTGRLSSEKPNLQNVPQESYRAKPLREAFVPDLGKVFLSFDYSQMELRILASLSQDKKMMEVFKSGGDIHTATASFIFKTEPKKVTLEMRRVAKTLNFGIVYGMGRNAFSETSGVSKEEAGRFIENYFENFADVKRWQENIKREARTLGYVTTLSGRRRKVSEINSSSPRFRAQAERVTINMPTQGLGADIMKLALIKVDKVLREEGWRGKEVKMLLTIHDELLFEVDKEVKEEAARIIKKEMEGAFRLSVPLVVEEKEGESWGEMKKIKNTL